MFNILQPAMFLISIIILMAILLFLLWLALIIIIQQSTRFLFWQHL